MSAFGVEAALHAIAASKALRAKFMEDPALALVGRPLNEEERRSIIEFDIGRLLKTGVNPMMLQGFWVATRGPAAFPEFVRRVNALEERAHG